MGEGRCLSLDCSEKARDQAVRVLKHFNVQPTPSDIFSRCQVLLHVRVFVFIRKGKVQTEYKLQPVAELCVAQQSRLRRGYTTAQCKTNNMDIACTVSSKCIAKAFA